MRTTEDLIEELNQNGEGYDNAGLAVGFENTTVFVWLHDPECQARAASQRLD